MRFDVYRKDSQQPAAGGYRAWTYPVSIVLALHTAAAAVIARVYPQVHSLLIAELFWSNIELPWVPTFIPVCAISLLFVLSAFLMKLKPTRLRERALHIFARLHAALMLPTIVMIAFGLLAAVVLTIESSGFFSPPQASDSDGLLRYLLILLFCSCKFALPFYLYKASWAVAEQANQEGGDQ